MTLDPSQQYELLRELATEFALAVLGPTTRADQVRAGVVALHTVADILGHSPSAKEYRAIREHFPELKLPPDANIRRWLAAGWNECLRLALLETVSDGDFASRPSGTTNKFSDADTLEALRECANDLGHVPGWAEYFAWASRPDVIERPGRRPRSLHPFERLGGFRAALVAAGLIDESQTGVSVDGRVLPLRYAYGRSDYIDALLVVARRLARSPRPGEYQRERTAIERERPAGKLSVLPSADTIRKFFGSWAAALAAAGLPAVETRQPSFTGKQRPSYTDEEKLAWIRDAWIELGDPFTSTAYEQRRRRRAAAGEDPGPSLTAIARSFGGWRNAVALALPSDGDADSPRPVYE